MHQPGSDRLERLHTSIRTVGPQTTLSHAKAWANMARIHAVRDITQMDCLGVPIFVSERRPSGTDPYAFGKGCLPIESEVGAYMEAIESHFSEPGVGRVETRWGTPRDLANSGANMDPVFEFAPVLDRHAGPDQPLLLARAHDVNSGAEAWIPAELVFNPSPDVGAVLYGASSNGLASGNSVLEATIHALYELIERDIWSTEFVRGASVRVIDESLPPETREVIETADRNGLRLVIRTVANDYGMPFCAAFLFDPQAPLQRFFNGGWGCHLDRRIALTRAVTEAAQSRAAALHGGREMSRGNGPECEADSMRAQMDSVSSESSAILFGDISEPPAATSLAAQWDATLHCLRQVIDRPVYRVVYTPQEGPIHVVRLVVPTMEYFSRSTMRIGPRLRAELEASANELDEMEDVA
jgi:ribosomal protein S12 methylthiotransferase accessory factor